MQTSILKNNAESTENIVKVNEDIFVVFSTNETSENKEVIHQVKQNFIQFHFCCKEAAVFVFNQGSYTLDVPESNMILLYNPQQILPLHLRLVPKAMVISVFISIQKFHSLFSQESNFIDFLSAENADKKYYSQEIISPQMEVILYQMQTTTIHNSLYPLYIKGKIFELLSIHFNRNIETEQCPFLADEENVLKIRKAKEFIIQNMLTPPSLQELADEVGITLKRLKTGFKQIYGDSVYNFLFDYKMEQAKKYLESGQYNINELSLKFGYSTPSHFISAFKKKFGTTPKKYISDKE